MKVGNGYLLVDRPQAPLRVLMLHHAGGSALSLLPMAHRLPAGCEPVLLELPGRGLREAEPLVADFAAGVAALAPVFAELIDRPVLVFGHSLGAVLAHNLVAGLAPEQRALVRTVVVSAFPAPQLAAWSARHPAAPMQLWDRELLLAELRTRGGSPAQLFEDPELLANTLRLIGHDLHLIDTYRLPEPVEVHADYQVWYGWDDNRLPVVELAGWAGWTAGRTTVRGFPGGHFYLLQASGAADALRALVAEQLSLLG